MLVIAFHEFGHAITACCTGGRVKSISLDPHEGGVTHMQGGISAVTLPAGYLGSSIIGALLIFAGFDIVASKVASIVLGVCFLLTLWWARRDWLTIGTVLLAVGLLVACWFIAHGEALRWVVVSFCLLYRGVMGAANSLETAFHRCNVRTLQRLGYRKFPSTLLLTLTGAMLTKQCDDLIIRKVNTSDASVFAQRYGGSSRCWGVIWSIISLMFMAVGIIGGIAAFHESFSQQQTDSKQFIPTR